MRLSVVSGGEGERRPEGLVARGAGDGETTDKALFVYTSAEEVEGWDRARIEAALIREAGMDPLTAEQVARAVEEQISRAGIRMVTAPLIRELVNAKLIEMGLEAERMRHTRLGVPVYDAREIITFPNKENANVPHGPEATNLTLAEAIKKEFALLEVFSPQVGQAHMRGDIHLHDLGFVDRPYCSGQSLEYLKRFGLNLPNSLALAKPAKHPEVLLAHMVKFAAALQSNFAGAIGWDAVNLFFAPYLEGMSDREIKQLAQMLVFEFSQQAVARGGQAIFTDINLYWEVPAHFEKVEAIGPGGRRTGKTYGEYAPWAQKFLWKLFEVYMEGDGAGRPFFFPKPLVHITERFFRTPGHERFLELICEVAAAKGNTYFVFDRGQTAKVSECCRLSFKLDASDLADARTPWKMRYCALQNVTVNLPRIAYEAAGDTTRLFQLLRERVALAVEAHQQKRRFITELLAKGSQGPLGLLLMNLDGEPYLRMHRVTYLVGMVGLNEMIAYHTGKPLHSDPEAFKLGLTVIAQMKLLCDYYSQRTGLHFVLEQTPAESTAYRFAKLDLKHFPDQAKHTVCGDLLTGEVYYTNSTHFHVGAPVNPIERVKMEGRFHPLIEAGAITHVWLGEARPSAASLANFVRKIFDHTQNDQVAFSPEFTWCQKCRRTARGLHETCPSCGSSALEHITRITGYFTKVASWNKGKLGELRDRWRNPGFFEAEAGSQAV